MKALIKYFIMIMVLFCTGLTLVACGEAQKSTDANLSGITVTRGTLSPSFAATTYEYTVTLPYGTELPTAVSTVTGTPAHSKAIAVTTVEDEVFTIIVTAEDCVTKKIYTVTYDVETPSLDLRYELNNDETGYVVSKGSADTTGKVIIPEIYLGKPVTEIKDYAFWDCIDMTEIIIPASVISIGNYAFAHCAGLMEITIPASVISIGGYAFAHCAGLTEITIPASVKSIDKITFIGCSGLSEINVAIGNTVYKSEGNCLIEKLTNRLILGCKTSNIPNSVIIIGSFAFDGCSDLTEITIPTSVEIIGDNAFNSCSGLTEITIPYSVIIIGSNVFTYCTQLKEVYVQKPASSGIITLMWYVFNNCHKDLVIYVPDAESLAAYQAADNWKNYTIEVKVK